MQHVKACIRPIDKINSQNNSLNSCVGRNRKIYDSSWSWVLVWLRDGKFQCRRQRNI